MKTVDLLRNKHKSDGNEQVPYSQIEKTDRRRLLKRILAWSKFSQYTDTQLDNLTAYQLPDGRYLINDCDGYECIIKSFEKAEGDFNG